MHTVLSTLHVILICVEVLLLFNLIIAVHELGHFLAGRWRGLVIEEFAVWFGKPLWQRTIHGVKYTLGSLPLGGFVKLPQMAPMDAIEGESSVPRAQLPAVTVLDKIIVAAAGPLFSLLLALVFGWIVHLVGYPSSQAETSKVIGYVVPDSPAEKAGMEAGDKILEVDGHPITKFNGMTNSVVWYVIRSEGKTIHFKVERDGKVLDLYPEPRHAESTSWLQRKSLRQVLIEPAATPTVAKINKGSLADQAGLQAEDEIEKVDGQTLLSVRALLDYEQAHAGQPMTLTIRRNKQPLELKMTAPEHPLRIKEVFKGGPAANAGLKAGDAVLAVNGDKVVHQGEVSDRLKASNSQPVKLTVARGAETIDHTVTPQKPIGGDAPMIGLGWDDALDGIAEYHAGGPVTAAYPGPLEQVGDSVTGVVNTIGAIFSRSDIKAQHLGGPVMILRTFYELFNSEYGWRLALWFSVMLNVNLAMLNLLPIPMLDGGHILLALIEAVRRKPMNLRLLEGIQTACFVMIAGYILYVTFYDVVDSPFSRRRDSEELHFSSPAPASPPPDGASATP